MNAADTSWMLVSTALVLLMTPALAFFYGGLVRSKNALNTMMMSFISLGFVGVVWADCRVLAVVCARQQLDWRPLAARPERRRPRASGHHPALPVHGLPGHVLHHHGGADLRRDRRADAVLGLCRVHHAVGAGRLRADRPLGLGRRLAGRHGRPRFRRRHRRARERRRGGAGRGPRRRQAPRLQDRRAHAAQRAVRAARRRPALVRLVRLQRRQRAGGGQLRGAGLYHDVPRADGDAGRVDAARLRPRRQADGGRRGHGHRRRTGGGHAGGGASSAR